MTDRFSAQILEILGVITILEDPTGRFSLASRRRIIRHILSRFDES